MKRLILTIIVTFSVASLSIAQHGYVFDHYFKETTVYNPATTGLNNALLISGMARHQWIGIKDNDQNVYPRSYAISGHVPISSIQSGAGINIIYDQAGFYTDFLVKLNYSYHLKQKGKHDLSVGGAINILNRSLDFSQLRIVNEYDFDHPYGDSKEAATWFEFDLGLFYRYNKSFHFGISAQNLLPKSKELGSFYIKRKTAIIFHSEYHHSFVGWKRQTFELVPSVQMLNYGTHLAYTVNMNLEFPDNYWFGLGSRQFNSILVNGGLYYQSWAFGVLYDFFAESDIPFKYRHSAEIFIGYNLPMVKKIKTKSGYNTRYL